MAYIKERREYLTGAWILFSSRVTQDNHRITSACLHLYWIILLLWSVEARRAAAWDSGAYSLGSVKKYNILSLSIYTYKCLIFPFLFNKSFSIKNTISEKMISGPSRGSLVTQKNRVTYIAFDVKISMMHKNVSLMSRYQWRILEIPVTRVN